jgi:SLT domain-containing protein
VRILWVRRPRTRGGSDLGRDNGGWARERTGEGRRDLVLFVGREGKRERKIFNGREGGWVFLRKVLKLLQNWGVV